MHLLDTLLSYVAPFDCLACGQEGALLCESCQHLLGGGGLEFCYRCRQPAHAICSRCSQQTGIDNLWVTSEYQGIEAQVIKSLKFVRARSAAQLVAQAISSCLPALSANTLVCGIPTASARVRQRGYDQAKLIARALARGRGLCYRDLLIRQGQTRQLGANRRSRQQQLHNAFRVSSAAINQPVLLIDDVMTTGATVEAAAACLRAAGFNRVSAAVFAYKL